MSRATVRLLPPVPWKSGLVGEYAGQRCVINLAPEVEMIFCWCPPTPPGETVLLGSPPDELERQENEEQHAASFPDGFWMAQHPVSQQQWSAVVGENPSRKGKGELHPVDSVSWNAAQAFCKKTGLRLPLEADWEYACRAGSATPFGIGEGRCLNAQQANFDGGHPYGNGSGSFKWRCSMNTLQQGNFPPNAWGLHDMHGQLWEWCEDEYSSRFRSLRGGSWFNFGRLARSASRLGSGPGYRYDVIGFRPCFSSTRPGPEPARRAAGQGVERGTSETIDPRSGRIS